MKRYIRKARVNFIRREPNAFQRSLPMIQKGVGVSAFIAGLYVMSLTGGALHSENVSEQKREPAFVKVSEQVEAESPTESDSRRVAQESEPITAKVFESARKVLIQELADTDVVESVDSMGPNAFSITLKSDALFPIGTASLDKINEPKLRKIVTTLNSVKPSVQIDIEGHTDNSPLVKSKGRFDSNWDLSAARASRLVTIFEDAGFDKEQLRAVGYGDSRPRAKVPGANRRIVVKVSEAGRI